MTPEETTPEAEKPEETPPAPPPPPKPKPSQEQTESIRQMIRKDAEQIMQELDAEMAKAKALQFGHAPAGEVRRLMAAIEEKRATVRRELARQESEL
jgi:hypothetical protein